MLGTGKTGGLQHVSLLDHPSTQSHAAQQNRFTGFIDDVGTIGAQKMLSNRLRSTPGEKQEQDG